MYNIKLRPGYTLKVYCVDDGWTVIQSRGQFGNPIDYFNRDWKSYVEGFGVPGKNRSLDRRENLEASKKLFLQGQEQWLGLNNIYDLTDKKRYQLRIKMTNFHRVEKTVFYDDFHLEDRVSKRKLFDHFVCIL